MVAHSDDFSHVGLSSSEASIRLQAEGANELPTEDARNTWHILLELLKEPMIFLIVAAGVIFFLLAEVLDASEDLYPSFFEVTTAACFLAFARHPADACVIEVGLGGRFDATNVLDGQAACGIATLGIDHEAFLLVPEDGVPTDPLCRIAFEKAGIARAGVPLVTQAYPDHATASVLETAQKLRKLIDMLEEDDDVQTVTHNFDIPEDVAAQLE